MKSVYDCKTPPDLYAFKCSQILLNRYYQQLTITERIYCKPYLFQLFLPFSTLSFMSLHGNRFGLMMCESASIKYYKKEPFKRLFFYGDN